MSRREHIDAFKEEIKDGREIIARRTSYLMRRFPKHAVEFMRLGMQASRTTKRATGERIYDQIEAIRAKAERTEETT